MRRSRYAGFYRTFTPQPSPASEPAQPVPSVSYPDVHREICRRWYPRGEFVRIVDAKQREWLVYDASDYCTHRLAARNGPAMTIVRRRFPPLA